MGLKEQQGSPALPFYYGGQAVIEGVMIRGHQHAAVAVRRPDGNIALRLEPLKGIYSPRLRRIPLLRGIIALWETLALGIKALVFSSNVALEQEDEEISSAAIWVTLAVAFVVAAAIFFAGPALLTGWLEDVTGSGFLAVLLEGLLRLGIFIGYIYAISLLPDIKRVFAYHGAEHKAINAFEMGAPLQPEAVQRFSTAHARCGTAFLLTVMVVALVIFTLLGSPSLWPRLLSRIVLIPVIAAISYEFIRLGADHGRGLWRDLLMRPGLALQAITTRQPDNGQVEVAIYALRSVLEADGVAAAPEVHPVPPGNPAAPSCPER